MERKKNINKVIIDSAKAMQKRIKELEEIIKVAYWSNHLTEEHKEKCWEQFKVKHNLK